MRYFLAGLFAAIFATTLFGQTSFSTSLGPNGRSGSARFDASRAWPMLPLTGAPYSAEEVAEDLQTLADGTHISRQFAPTKVYRDSAGRIRRERPLFRGPVVASGPTDAPTLVEISDPGRAC
jgi:hypothetical protein